MLALAARDPVCTPIAVFVEEAKLADELGLRSSIHVGNGSWGHLQPVRKMLEAGCDLERVTWVHGNSLPDSDFDLIKPTGGAVSCAPALESPMGDGPPSAGRCPQRGIA